MKKMKRLLAVILASLLILSSATAGASAYQAYKDDALTKYDFTDTAVLTTEQYASALLDYADKALAKANITMNLSVLGSLDATSIDNALSSVYKLINGNKAILWMAGDLGDVSVSAIKSTRRSNSTDVAVIESLLQFLADNKGIVKKVVVGGVGKYKRSGGIDLGVANSFVKVDLNVEVMLRQLIWGLAYPDTEYNKSNNVDSMLQVIIQNALAGVKEIPDSVRNLVDLNSTKSTYDFIEDLLQTAYNDIAVPLLNDQTMKWLGQEIDKDTTGTLAGLFNRDFRVSAYTVPAGSTLVAELNNIAGGIVNGLLKNYNGWVSGDNSKLTDNVVAVARYILKETGDYFFPDWQKHIATAEEIDAMSKEALIAYLARSIINASVGYMYIPEDVTTVVGVAWEAVKQLMAQFLPERDYSGYPKTVQGILDMLADYVAYNVNPGIDLNAGDLKKALNYGDGMDKMLTTAVQWLAAEPQNYTGLLPTTAIDTSDGWKALDDIFFKLLDKSILPAKFANSGSETILKDIVYSILNGLLVDQDLTCISDLFVKNESGAFAKQTLKQSIVRLVTDILNAVLPGTVTKTYGSLNEIVSNSELGSIVENLLGSLNSNKVKLVPPIVNIVAQVMKLTDKSKFGQMEFGVSDRSNGNFTVTVYNGSKGINRGYTDKNGNFTRYDLYKYVITGVSAEAYNASGAAISAPSVSGLNAGNIINGGDSANVALSGTTDDSLVILSVYYHIVLEDGTNLSSEPLCAKAYSYVKQSADVDNDSAPHTESKGPHNKSNAEGLKFKSGAPALLLLNQDNKNPLDDITKYYASVENTNNTKYYVSVDNVVSGTAANYVVGSSEYKKDKNYGNNGVHYGVLSHKDDNLASVKLWDIKGGATLDSLSVGSDINVDFRILAGRYVNAGLIKNYYETYYTGKMRVICYDDYGLPGLVERAIGANRSRNQYVAGAAADAAWSAYETALRSAAILVYRPGMIANYTNADFLASFKSCYDALEEAVYVLDGGKKTDSTGKVIKTYDGLKASASVDSLKTAVEAIQGKDNKEGAIYWDDGYTFFGYDDFNSVTWNGWKEARNRALNLYNSTIAPKEPVAPEKPGDDATLVDKQKYEKACAQWETDHAAWETEIAAWKEPVISSIDVAYAEQQVELWGRNLIKLDAVKTHLDAAIAMCTIDPADSSKYDAERWEAYAKSFAYAQKVSTSFNASTTMRTQVRDAMNNLIYNWKRLIANPVVTVTFTFTVNGVTHAVLTGNQGDPVDLSKIAAPDAPVGMHFVSWGNVPATFDADATFEAQFANNTDTKYTVNVYNMDTTGAYPSAPDSTYQGAGETGSTADITADAAPAEGFSLDSAKSVLTGTIAADGSLVLSIYYSRNQYTVTYANTDLAPDTYYYGATVVARTPEKAGFNFDGWEEEVPSTMPAQNITLTAKWNENPADYTDYDIAVDAAKAKKAEANYDKTYTEASRKALDAALAVDVSNKKRSEQGVVDAQTAAINAAVKGLKLMTYNAEFYVDNELYRTVATEVGAQIVAPEAPPKVGYTFTGWNPEVGVMGVEDVRFDAKFSAGEVSYTVETYVMGLDGEYGAAETKNVPATTGEAVSVTPETREGFTVADNSVLSGTVEADSSLVLKVYYSRNQYKLSVDGVESDVYYGAALNIAAPAAREGFTFAGWNVEVPANMPAENLTLVSQWSENDADYSAYNAAVSAAQAKKGEENYDKKYTAETRAALAEALANDVAGKKYSEQSVVDAATKAINDAVAALKVMTYNAIFTVDGVQYEVVPTKVGEQIVAPKDPAKEGYVFKGWDKEVGKMGVEDITFTAQFEKASGIAYTVEVYTMDVNGNYGAAETKTLYGTTDATVNADTTAAEGFTFDESADNVVSGKIAADGSLVLKVYFARNQYKLTVDGAESMVYYGAAISVAEPTKAHETFNGWDPALPETMPAHDVTVVSTWIKADADYTEYKAARAHAEGIVNDSEYPYEATYTAESRAALDAALAIVVPKGLKYDEQHIIDAAKKAIEDAVLGLELMRYKVTYLYDDGSVFAEFDGDKGGLVSYQVPVPSENPTKEGYVFTGWDHEIPENMPAHELTFTAQFSAGEVTYTVETYEMDVNGTYGAATVKTVPATTGEAVSVTPDAREGFTVDNENSILSGTVAADGSLVLKVYYSRNQYKLTVDGVESMVYYGAAISVAEPTKAHETFNGWDPALPETMPAHDVTVVSTWIKDDADYSAYNEAKAKAEAKQNEENYDKKYTAETRNALAEALKTVVPEGLKYDEQHIINAATTAINDAVKALELETYTATFYVNGEVHATVTAKVGEQIAAPADPIVDGYNFTGWDPEVGTMGIENVRFDAILVASGSSIISVTPATPNYGGMHQYAVKVKGEPQKLRIVDAYGTTRTFDRNTSMTSDVNAFGILKIEKTEDGEIWTLNVNLVEGEYTALAKFDKAWEEDGYDFTVKFDTKPSEPVSDGVLDVTYNTPNYGGKQEYFVKVSGKADKIQIAYENGGTTTRARYDLRVSIKSYDAQGNEVDAKSANLAYEIWTVKLNIAEGKHVARAKYGKVWTGDHEFTVVYDVKPAPKGVVDVTYDTPNYGGKQQYSFKVDGKASKIQIAYGEGGTTTFIRIDPRVSIKSYDAQGNEVSANSADLAYEIWTVKLSIPEGKHLAKAKYGKTWTDGFEFDVVITSKPIKVVSVTAVSVSADSVAVTVNGTAKKVRITYASGATRTYDRDDIGVSIASNGDGEIWTINVKLTEGDYTATAKYMANGKQVWDTTDFAFTV